MKQKTKRLLAGLGIGLALGSSAMLTGCSSNLDIKQGDLDRTITNTNDFMQNGDEYLDSLRNKSEYVKNELNGLLLNGIYSSMGVKNIAYSCNTEFYMFGTKIDETIQREYKRNVQNNLIKQYEKYSSDKLTERYHEVEVVSEVNSQTKYKVKEYSNNNNSTKTYTEREETDYTKAINDMGSLFADYIDVYSNYYGIINMTDSGVSNGLSMEFDKVIDDDTVTYRCNTINSSSTNNSRQYSFINLSFKDNKITKVEMISFGYLDNLGEVEYSDGYQVDTYEFDYTNETISFDKTGYTTQG